MTSEMVPHAESNKYIFDTNGQKITFTYLGDAGTFAETLSDYLGINVNFCGDCKAPVLEEGQRPLSASECTVAESFAWYFRNYGEGLRRGQTFNMPLINPFGDFDFAFADEERANMFADIIETVFEYNAVVIEDLSGWKVVVASEFAVSGEVLEQLCGACRVLLEYPVGDYHDVTRYNRSVELVPSPEARARRRRKPTQLDRIENLISSLSAALAKEATT